MSTISKLKSKVLFLALPLVTLLPLISFLFLSTPTALAAGAREYENPPCYDVTGQTQAVLVGGVNNGGIMDFDDAGVPAAQAACVRMKADKVTPDHLEGWVWNDNLGWVSLYCPGGVGAMNLDIACGTQAYSVTFGVTGGTAPNFTTVTMSGYAWGDNIGWINFDSTFSQLKPTPSGSNRGLIPAAPAPDHYTWTDSVGWLDWTNVWFHWEDTDPPMTDPNVIKYISVCSSKDLLPPVTDEVLKVDLSAYGNPQAFGYDQTNNKIWVAVHVPGPGPAPMLLVKVDAATGTVDDSVNLTTSNVYAGPPGPINMTMVKRVIYDPTHNAVWLAGNVESVYGDLWRYDIGTNVFTEVMRYGAHYNLDPIVLDTNHNVLLYSAMRSPFGTVYALDTDTNDPAASLSTSGAGSGFTDMTYDSANDILYAAYQASGSTATKVGRFQYAAGAINYVGGVDLATSSLDMGTTDDLMLAMDSFTGDLWGMNKSVSPVITKVFRKATSTLNTYTPTAATKPSNNTYFAYDTSRKGFWAGSLTGGADAFDFYKAMNGTLLGQSSLATSVSGGQAVLFDSTAKLPWLMDGNGKALFRLTPNVLDASGPGVPKCTCDLDGTCPIPTDPTKIPDANGTDDYDIKIPFVDGGVAIANSQIDECTDTTVDMYTQKPAGKDYCAKIALTWEDDVDYDQTTGTSQKQDNAKYNANNDGAVRKPLTSALYGVSDFTYDGVETLWGAKVTSFAPTSERNTMEGMPNEKFYYADSAVTDGGYDTTKSNQNLLKLREIKLLFFKYSTAGGVPGNCIYGNINGSNCEMRNYMENPSTFSFNPLVDIPKLSFQDLGNKLLNFISVSSPDNPITFVFQNSVFKAAATNQNISLKAGLQDESTYRMKFVDTSPEADENNAFVTRAFTSSTNQTLPAQLFSDSPGETLSSEAGPFVYSTVNYIVGGNNVKYFGPKLPRIKAGLLLNPVAKVEGNVYVTDFAKKASDVTLHSLGNISSNLRREAVVRNVAKYLNGFTGTPVSGDQTVVTGITDSIKNLTKLVDETDRKVFYLRDGDLTLGCSGGCAFDANTTFIVENGNIFVNSNIVPTGNNQVGLIALRDLETNAQNQGLLYIDKDVNWLSGVQIYLDRVVQSYDKTVVSLDANGFAQYADDDYARQGRFKNQLVIEGTISSMNGIGNASRSPATDENGLPLAAGTYCSNYTVLSGICRARVVDLNYLRYYGPGLEICTGSEGVGAIAGVPRDLALKATDGNGCNPTDPVYDIDASDLYAHDTNTDLISGGSGGTRSQYFVSKKLPETIANEFPVNFFYRPIAKSLAGFEVDSSINPLLQN